MTDIIEQIKSYKGKRVLCIKSFSNALYDIHIEGNFYLLSDDILHSVEYEIYMETELDKHLEFSNSNTNITKTFTISEFFEYFKLETKADIRQRKINNILNS